MKIGYLVPGIGLGEEERARRQSILTNIGSGKISLQLLEVDEGPESIESAEDEEKAVAPTVELAQTYEDQFNAYIIGCFGDVGIAELRKRVKIPIIGPARATYATAAALFPSFSVMALNQYSIAGEENMAELLGVRSMVREIKAVNLPVNLIIDNPKVALEQITKVAQQIDDVAVLPGCMSMAFLLQEWNITAFGALQVVNPLHCAIRVASTTVT